MFFDIKLSRAIKYAAAIQAANPTFTSCFVTANAYTSIGIQSYNYTSKSLETNRKIDMIVYDYNIL